MSIGAGIFLIAIGAVLSFALDGDLGGGVVDLNLVGYILMGAGLIVTLIGTALALKKRKTVSSTTVQDQHGVVQREDSVTASPSPTQYQ